MNDSQLEQALRAWFRTEIGDADPSDPLVMRIQAIPTDERPGVWLHDRLPAGVRPWQVAAVAILLLATALAVYAGSQLRFDHRPLSLAPPADPCELLTTDDLEATFGGEMRVLRNFPDPDWYPYSRDWPIPRLAGFVLGEGTRHCEYAREPIDPQALDHLELFMATRPTTTAEASSLVAELFAAACADTPPDGDHDTCGSSEVAIGAGTAWLSSLDASVGHLAVALSREPHLVVISMALDPTTPNRNAKVRATAELVMARLAWRGPPIAATPRPGTIVVGDWAPEFFAEPDHPMLRLAALRGQVVVVLVPAQVGADNDLGFQRLVMPRLELVAQVAREAGVGRYVVVAETDIAWLAVAEQLRSTAGDSIGRIHFVPTYYQHPTRDLSAGIHDFYHVDYLRVDPGDTKLVVIDPAGRVAAIYPYRLPGPDELERMVRGLEAAAG